MEEHKDLRTYEMFGRIIQSHHTLTLSMGILGIATSEIFDPEHVPPSRWSTYTNAESDMMPMDMRFIVAEHDSVMPIILGRDFALPTGAFFDLAFTQMILPDFGKSPTGCRTGHLDWYKNAGSDNTPLDEPEPSVFDDDGHRHTRRAMRAWRDTAYTVRPAEFPLTGFNRTNPVAFVVPMGH